MRFIENVGRPELIASAVRVDGVEVRDSGPTISEELERLSRDLASGRAGLTEDRKRAIRAVLRNGQYRPSGRGKPAQEFLAGLWERQGTIDLINNVVDVNNIISLRYGVPISVFDCDKVQGDLVLRLGQEDERYVFNASGQVLECRDLLVVSDDRGAIGSPVKDSQRTKVFPGATSVVYVVYGNRESLSEEVLRELTRELADMLVRDVPEGRSSGALSFEMASPAHE
jgi:DNA/RNA-binding domain of Phe-tRNA-synthetase-like protein